jgi:hypothetical protein
MPDEPLNQSHPASWAAMPLLSNPNVNSWLSTLAGALVILSGIVGYLRSNLPPTTIVPVAPPAIVQPAPPVLTAAEIQQILDQRKAQGAK